MSVKQSNDGVLRPILMRSSTPASNEKVLDYLESMGEADYSPPGSILDHEEYKSRLSEAQRTSSVASPAPKSIRSKTSELQELANSQVSYDHRSPPPNQLHPAEEGDADDADSNAQQRSEAGSALPIREPGPQDPPGPHYESYDSGPSFGNFGPLPPSEPGDFHPNPVVMSTWTPQFNLPNKTEAVPEPWQMMTPQGSVNIDFQSPSSPGSQFFQGGIPHSHKAPSLFDDKRTERAMSPGVNGSPTAKSKGHSRAGSRAATATVAPLSPPLSPTPMSVKSHNTGRTKGTVYPPLPESRMGDDDDVRSMPMSPRSRSRKAPSIAPSDSPSQAKVQAHTTGQSKTPSRKGPSAAVKSDAGDAASRPMSPGRPLVSSTAYTGPNARPFSPYRHAPTTEDLMYAAARGRALHIPDTIHEPVRTNASAIGVPSPPTSPRSKRSEAARSHAKAPSTKAPSMVSSHPAERPASKAGDATPRRAMSPDADEPLNAEENRIVQEAIAAMTPRTSYYSHSSLDPETTNPYHDMELCLLLHHLDSEAPEVVKKAIRKAVKQRVKKLGLKNDTESLKAFARAHRNHDPSVHARSDSDEPPKWAADIKRELVLMQQRIESLGPKIDGIRAAPAPPSHGGEASAFYDGDADYERTPVTQTVNIQTQPTGTLADSMYQPHTEVILDDEGTYRQEDDQEFDDIRTATPRQQAHGSQYTTSENDRDDSPGQQYLEQELWKLKERTKRGHDGSPLASTHRTWEVGPTEGDDEEGMGVVRTIPDGDGEVDAEGEYNHSPHDSPPLPPVPDENQQVVPNWSSQDIDVNESAPWQKIHQRLLGWAMIWPMSELDNALNSTTRGNQVDEVALSIWATQTYKRYVRSRLTDRPQGIVDRMFVPPNMADAISTAVFNGRHGEACGILRDLWSPFGLEGMPRLIIVLAKHRTDADHWVVHRFSLPEGSLTTYDTYPERTLPDGRPLGWWFAIRVAWPNAIYPSPDNLMQKMVRLHRPMQLPIDNSVSAAGIWRNLLMGSRAERSLDLERLRDLINTEVKNLRQRKLLGKLSINPPRPTWEDMN